MEHCPHQAERNNPAWWLKLGEKPGEALGLSIRVKEALPVLWGREYYTVAEKIEEKRAPCVGCDNTGEVSIKNLYSQPKPADGRGIFPSGKANFRRKNSASELVGSFALNDIPRQLTVHQPCDKIPKIWIREGRPC
jgi:hypothetical protein